MALQSSGAISLNNVNVELGNSGTASINMGSAAVRDLFGVASGAITMSDGYGKSAGGLTMSNQTTLDIGARMYPSNGKYWNHGEFNATGTQLYLQKSELRATFNLTTPYSLTGGRSLASVDYYECEEERDSIYNQYAMLDVVREITGTNKVIVRKYDKAYIYKDIHSATGGALESSGNMVSSSNVGASYSTECTLELEVGGKVYNLRAYRGKLCMTKYASQTSTTMESRSVLDTTAYSASGGLMYTNFVAISNTGTTLSFKTREGSVHYVYKMTLSTPFDISTASIPTVTILTSNVYDAYVERAVIIAYSNNTKYLTLDQYGGMRNFSFGTSGDINTAVKIGDAGRATFGGYQYCCSGVYWAKSGTQLSWVQYNGSGIVWDVSTPYQWKWEDRFAASSGIAYAGLSADFKLQAWSRGRFNTTGTRYYTNHYSGTKKIGSLALSTPYDLSTTSTGLQFDFTNTPYAAVGAYHTSHSWHDRDNNKLHLTSYVTSTDNYMIIDLDANGDYTGTYTMGVKTAAHHPSGFALFQPLTSNGEYFVSIESNKLVVYKLTVNFNPLDGLTEIFRGYPQRMVNGSLVNHTGVNVMYVLDNSIFLGADKDSWINKIDFTIT